MIVNVVLIISSIVLLTIGCYTFVTEKIIFKTGQVVEGNIAIAIGILFLLIGVCILIYSVKEIIKPDFKKNGKELGTRK